MNACGKALLLTAPVTTCRFTATGAVLRVTDARVPEFYVEIRLELHELQAILAEVLACRRAVESEK